jgi:uncharacterized membrane protein (DUF373 family)
MRRGGKGDAIPLIAFHNAPLLEAGFFTFGALLVVLIAIEIFINITLYLREDVIHVKLVIATALMAIARKAIVLDYGEIGYEYVYATAAVVLSLGITYRLIERKA